MSVTIQKLAEADCTHTGVTFSDVDESPITPILKITDTGQFIFPDGTQSENRPGIYTLKFEAEDGDSLTLYAAIGPDMLRIGATNEEARKLLVRANELRTNSASGAELAAGSFISPAAEKMIAEFDSEDDPAADTAATPNLS